MKKFLKCLGLLIILLIFMLILFRGWIYRESVNYKSLGSRKPVSAASEEFMDYQHTVINDLSCSDIHEVIKKSHQLTSNLLSFSFSNVDSDPNKLIHSGKANCIGYAQYYAMVANEILRKNSLHNDWVASTHIGQLHFLGKNLHGFLHHPYLKDHDFVILTNRKSGEQIAVDPSLRDYSFIDKVSLFER